MSNRYEIKKASELNSHYEVFGHLRESIMGAQAQCARVGVSPEAIFHINLQIESISCSLWSLIPLALITSVHGDNNDDMEARMKSQILREVDSVLKTIKKIKECK